MRYTLSVLGSVSGCFSDAIEKPHPVVSQAVGWGFALRWTATTSHLLIPCVVRRTSAA